MHLPPPTIPVVIEQQAFTTIEAMSHRGFKNIQAVPSTCRQVAVVVLAKWNEADKRMVRHLTNKMIAHLYDIEGV